MLSDADINSIKIGNRYTMLRQNKDSNAEEGNNVKNRGQENVKSIQINAEILNVKDMPVKDLETEIKRCKIRDEENKIKEAEEES